MTARALLLLALLTGAASGAEDAGSPFLRLRASDDFADRVRACAELSTAPHRGPLAYDALAAAMSRDLSERVRLAAAEAAVTYPGGQALADVSTFLRAEQGEGVRRALLVRLSTEPAHLDNPDATRVLIAALAEDPSAAVRAGAASALGARGDALALGAVGRASAKDADKGVRQAARRAMLSLSKPPKRKPAPKRPDPPKVDAVFGVDPCPRPWGWCVCAGAVKLKPKCRTREDCGRLQSDMQRHGLACAWDGRSDD